MTINPKNVRQAVRLAVALANPTLRKEDWEQVKVKFQIDDETLNCIKLLIDTCEKKPELKTILSCLTSS